MIYNDFQGMKLSALGQGTMRLPVIDGDESRIDADAARDMIAYSMEQGINYYDTAYGYHGGTSEKVVGEILKDYDRSSFYLASKFPGYDLSHMTRVKEIFEEQLLRCQVEYFDFYLIHNVCELNISHYLDPKYGIYEYLMEQKRNGRIKHLGFSAHGDVDCVRTFLDAYGAGMEFGMIELNYYDYQFQNAKGKMELLAERNIPLWVMEPFRGGQLASLSDEVEAKLKTARPDEGIPAWAFRFLQTVPGVVVTLTGASNMRQLQENIKTFEERKPLTAEEMDLLLGIADEMISQTAIPCTACRYCTSKCPKELDIPYLLKLFNESLAEGPGWFIAPMALGSLPADKQPHCCIGCRACEQVCPQMLPISNELARFAKKMS